jgi:hypothetical protein
VAKTANGTETHYTLDVAVGLVQVLVETTGEWSTVYLHGHDLLGEEGTAWLWHLNAGLGSVRHFVQGGDLTDKVKQALRGRYENDLEFDNWGELLGDPYQFRDPGGIVFDRGKVYRNFLESWQ